MHYLAAVLAICATACLRPPNKQTGYLANGAAATLGAVFLADSLNRDCSGMNIGESIGCGINKDGGKVAGISLIAIGAIGLIVTAVSDAPDKP